MRLRAVFVDGVTFLLWAFICFIYLGIYGFNILLSSGGVVFGLVYGVVLALRHIKNIEKNGEFRITRKILAFMLLAIIIIVPTALYLLFSLGLEAGIQMLNFACPIIPAFYAARMILYLDWERKHARRIFFEMPYGLVLTKVYAVPRTESR